MSGRGGEGPPHHPLVSVVIPTYNRASLLLDALASVRLQTFRDFEVIVIDDASTDGTEAVMATYRAVAPVLYHRNTTNLGASESRNRGVALARGELVVFLDSDDRLEPEHLEAAVDAFRRDPELALWCCDSRVIDAGGHAAQESWVSLNSRLKAVTIRSGYRTLEEIFLFSTCFPGMTVRRDLFLALGGMRQSVFPLDDVDFALRVAGAGHRVYYLHRPLACYRCHDGNESGTRQVVRTCRSKVACLRSARRRHPALARLGGRARYRIADARLELAIALVREGRPLQGVATLLAALATHPSVVRELLRLAAARRAAR